MDKEANKKRKKIRRKRNRKPNKFTRLMIAFSGVSLVLLALVAYVFHIGMKNQSEMTINLLNQARYRSFEIPSRRGDIIDASGVVLATSIKTYDVALDVQYLLSVDEKRQGVDGEETTVLDTTVKELSDSFKIDEDKIRDIIKENSDDKYYVLIKGINQDQKDSFESKYIFRERDAAKIYSENSEEDAKTLIKKLKKEKSIMKDLIKGVILETKYTRHYPYKALASNVIGFCDSQNIGQTGIEKYYDDYLNGKNGKVYSYMDASMIPITKEKVLEDGRDLKLTLDIRYQKAVEKNLKEFKKEHEGIGAYGAKNIAVIVMEPKTGAIKAMASNFGYDLNKPRDLEIYNLYTKEEIEKMTDTQLSDALNDLWKNYCISAAYEPGSTFKPLLLSYALDTGAVNYGSGFECKGHLEVGDRKINCSSRIGHGKENLEEALVNSCNVAFMKIGFNLKKEGLESCQNLFNFGLKTNIDLPDEVYTYNSIHRADNMNIIDLATNSFGQNFDVSMIQMITAFSSVVNGGTYYQPRLVSEIINTYNNTTIENKPVVIRKTVSENASKSLKKYLHITVKSRESKEELEDGKRIEIGGKTGTAEKLPRDKKNYLISFIGFTPIDEPKLVCYVVIDEPNVEKQDNSKIAMELGKKIIRELGSIK